MIIHEVAVSPSSRSLAQSEQLAGKIAEIAVDPVPVEDPVTEMVINRIIDNAAVSVASLVRDPVISARDQALAHGVSSGGAGASIIGVAAKTSPEWAAWANGVAVRELDFHDTFLAADYSHPGDNIPALIAVAEHCQRSGTDLLRAITTAYETQVNLVKGICLHEHKIDHVAHLAPAVAAGLGTLLALDKDTVFQSIGQALHVSTATRQSRKGLISTWKAYAPAFAAKMAVEAVDRAMRGQSSPAPIYEGEDGVIGWLLSGPEAVYQVPLPGPGETKRAILDTYTKEHSAEYQAQAWIDIARKLHQELPDATDPRQVQSIRLRTSHHTHMVIGSGAQDPQKYDPAASRETLDHSIPYIFAVALQDGSFHHEHSYTPQRAHRADTVELWQKITTEEDPGWTRRYHSSDITEKAFGGAVEITFTDGRIITDEIAVADAHPLGARPFVRENYVQKFRSLSAGVISDQAAERFLDQAQSLPELRPDQLRGLVIGPQDDVAATPTSKGIF